MTRAGYQEVEVMKAALPVDLALGIGGFTTIVDASLHLWRGLGLGSSLAGTADTVIGVVGAMNPFHIFWGIVMVLVSVTLFGLAKRTKN